MKIIDLLNLESCFDSESCRIEITNGSSIDTIQLNSTVSPVSGIVDERCGVFKASVLELIRSELKFELNEKLGEL